jgi:hypothetical protein
MQQKWDSFEMEKDLTKLPAIKGMIKQMEAYWEKQNEIESMLKNQADMQTDADVQAFMSQIYAGFCWENIRRAMFHMGFNLFPQQWEAAAQAEWVVCEEIRRQRQKRLESAVMEDAPADSAEVKG